MPTYRLTKLCRIERRKSPRNDFEPGDTGGEPSRVCDCWAEITQLSATEQVSAQQIYGGSTHRIIIRWPHKAIDPGMWVIANKTAYEIMGVKDLDGAYLELSATQEQVGKGTVTTR